jgi:hypothetical protein
MSESYTLVHEGTARAGSSFTTMDQGKRAEPLPLRAVLTYKNAKGDAQFRAQFSDWNLAPEIATPSSPSPRLKGRGKSPSSRRSRRSLSSGRETQTKPERPPPFPPVYPAIPT